MRYTDGRIKLEREVISRRCNTYYVLIKLKLIPQTPVNSLSARNSIEMLAGRYSISGIKGSIKSRRPVTPLRLTSVPYPSLWRATENIDCVGPEIGGSSLRILSLSLCRARALSLYHRGRKQDGKRSREKRVNVDSTAVCQAARRPRPFNCQHILTVILLFCSSCLSPRSAFFYEFPPNGKLHGCAHRPLAGPFVSA